MNGFQFLTKILHFNPFSDLPIFTATKETKFATFSEK